MLIALKISKLRGKPDNQGTHTRNCCDTEAYYCATDLDVCSGYVIEHYIVPGGKMKTTDIGLARNKSNSSIRVDLWTMACMLVIAVIRANGRYAKHFR